MQLRRNCRVAIATARRVTGDNCYWTPNWHCGDRITRLLWMVASIIIVVVDLVGNITQDLPHAVELHHSEATGRKLAACWWQGQPLSIDINMRPGLKVLEPDALHFAAAATHLTIQLSVAGIRLWIPCPSFQTAVEQKWMVALIRARWCSLTST